MDNRGLGQGDRDLIRAVQTGEGLVELTPEMIRDLAPKVFALVEYSKQVAASITDDQATFARNLRDEGYTWRAVAETCHLEWGGDWKPPWNQAVGEALCGEAYRRQAGRDSR